MNSLHEKAPRYLLLCLALLCGIGSYSSFANLPGTDPGNEPESCTSIMVGRLASDDGSIITCHTCDGNYRTWLNIVPHQKHPAGSRDKIYWGNLHTETPWDMRGKLLKGEIPQVEETYAYLNVAYPSFNEKQLGIGETTIGGRQELQNDEGLFLIEELERIALERCTNARDAIRLIGQLVKEYGYGDSGECITIADKKEIWHFEIFGAGPAEKGAVWAAARIPDDHVGVSANRPRIGELKLDEPDRYMASENVFKVAEEMGWWDPKKREPFKFWKAYSDKPPFSDREFFILSTLAPNLSLRKDTEELPFSVKPSRKLSIRDVMKYYRETYEGTEYDMTKNLMVPKARKRGEPEPPQDARAETVKSPVASGWMSSDMITLLNTLKPGTVERQRTIAIAACSYSQIVQIRPWLPNEIGGIAWFSFDNPGQSPRFPIFAGVLSLPKSFEIDGQQRFRPDAAIWSFRMANRLATVRWGESRKYIEEAVKQFEDRAFQELPAIEKIALELYNSDGAATAAGGNGADAKPSRCREFLTRYTNDFARATIDKWSELTGTFWESLARPF